MSTPITNKSTTLYRWLPDSEGEAGTLTLWPDSDTAMEVRMENFAKAKDLADAIIKHNGLYYQKGWQAAASVVNYALKLPTEEKWMSSSTG